MKQVPVIVHFLHCPFDFLLRLFNNKKIILTKVTMTVLLVMTNNSVLMQHNIRLVQLPFYNITPNISVCNNYISPYFFATCFQYNFANRVNLSSACVQIQFNSEPLLCLPNFKEKEWNAISVKMQYFNSFANSLLFWYIIKEDQ